MPNTPPSDKMQVQMPLPPELSDAELAHPTQTPLRPGTLRLQPWLLDSVAVVLGLVGLLGGCSSRTDKTALPAPKPKEESRKGPVGPVPAEKPAVQIRKPKQGAPFTNSIGMKFVWITPGSFRMGSSPGEAERSRDETPHHVTLTKGFYLGVHLVTQYQWEQVMGKDANESRYKGKDEDEKKQLPVHNVSWEDCTEFCNKLGVREGRRYRLPTEAEWEYACRAGTTTAFWWGDSITPDQANYDGKFTYGPEGKKGVFRDKTTPVGFFKANPWDLHDMHGNLYQWCADWYGPYGESDQTDPLNTIKDEGERVLRGGSWVFGPKLCRAAHRLRSTPGARDMNVGCRVALCLD